MTPQDALAAALQTEWVRKYVAEAWVDAGVSEAGYATPDEQAAVILAALARDGWVLVNAPAPDLLAAARAYLDAFDMPLTTDPEVHYDTLTAAREALRAAIEEADRG